MVLVGQLIRRQPFDVLPGFGVQQSNHGNSQQLDVFAKAKNG